MQQGQLHRLVKYSQKRLFAQKYVVQHIKKFAHVKKK